jgi:DNA invertase Pin-like site-specific DNA recombinase
VDTPSQLQGRTVKLNSGQLQIIAAVYLRQSKDQFGDNLAVDRQREVCLEVCRRQGWTPKFYVDDNVSATSPRVTRKAYQQMLKDIESGAVRAVVVQKLDRLHRRRAELDPFLLLARDAKIQLATAEGTVDFTSAQGKLLLGVMAEAAEYEMNVKAERQMAMHDQRVTRMVPFVARRPFGYQVVKDAKSGRVETLAPHPVEGPLVTQGYAALLAGASQASVYQAWNRNGHLTTMGNPWVVATFRKFILSERNAGVLLINDQRVEGAWTPLVTPEDFRAITLRLSANVHTRGESRVKGLLTGILRCGLPGCGGPMNRSVRVDARTVDRSATRGSYRCKGCGRMSRQSGPVDDVVKTRLLARLTRSDVGDLLMGQADQSNVQALAAERVQVRGYRDDLDAAVKAKPGALPMAIYIDQRQALTSRLDELDHQAVKVSQEPVLLAVVQALQDAARDLSPAQLLAVADETFEALSLEERRQLIRAVFASMVIMPAKKSGPGFDPTDVVTTYVGESARVEAA